MTLRGGHCGCRVSDTFHSSSVVFRTCYVVLAVLRACCLMLHFGETGLLTSVVGTLQSFLTVASEVVPIAGGGVPTAADVATPVGMKGHTAVPMYRGSAVALPRDEVPAVPEVTPELPGGNDNLCSQVVQGVMLVALVPSPAMSDLLVRPSKQSQC